MFPSLFDSFPKTRKELPPEFTTIFKSYFIKNRQGATIATSLSMRMEKWLHVKVAEDVMDGKSSNLTTLEIGAGMLNQIPYEPVTGKYDIVEPNDELYGGSVNLGRISKVFADISEIPAETKYDRITSIAAFEHILDLPKVVAKTATLLKKNGFLRVSIPNEGTLLWKLGTYVTGYEFKRMYGLDFQVFVKNEHVNTADEIDAVLNYFFRYVSTSVLGISKRLAFYRFIRCADPDVKKAEEYLQKYYS